MSRTAGLDAAWRELFRRHRILERIEEEGRFSITAAAINEVREARLMAKFDRSAQLPPVFREHGLSILPDSRGSYVIGPFLTHRPVRYDPVRPKRLASLGLETLDESNLYSEAAVLLACCHGGLFEDLLGEKCAHTIGGRMGSGDFSFRIANTRAPNRPFTLDVHNAQVEIDAGYESRSALLLCECKNMASEELLIRQLYYPYRLWRGKVRKPVIPLFLACSNDVFHAFLCRFEDDGDYNSLALVRHGAYTFAAQGLELADAEALWRRAVPGPEPAAIPFPQANSFARVVDLLGVLWERELTRDEVTMQYEFDPRQTDYYISACQYLGLAERGRDGEGNPVCRLTEQARRILGRPYREKQLGLMEAVLRRPVFHRAFGLALRCGGVPGQGAVARVMREENLPLNQRTLDRRASTVRGWIGWLLEQCGAEDQLTLE